MRTLQLVMGGVWCLFAIAFIVMAIAEFNLFYSLMAVGCAGVSGVSFLQYRWSQEDRNW